MSLRRGIETGDTNGKNLIMDVFKDNYQFWKSRLLLEIQFSGEDIMEAKEQFQQLQPEKDRVQFLLDTYPVRYVNNMLQSDIHLILAFKSAREKLIDEMKILTSKSVGLINHRNYCRTTISKCSEIITLAEKLDGLLNSPNTAENVETYITCREEYHQKLEAYHLFRRGDDDDQEPDGDAGNDVTNADSGEDGDGV